MPFPQLPRAGHVFSDVTVGDGSRAQLGDQIAHNITNNYSTNVAHPRFRGYYGRKTLRPVTCYVARPDLQAQLKETLHDTIQQRDDYSKILAVCGLGGAGKSQLMLNYIKQYKSDYSSIFWLDAGAKERLDNDFRQIHNLLLRPSRSDIDLSLCISEVKQWCDLEEGRLLFVFDSADDIDDTHSAEYIDLREYLVDAHAADIVITTRSQSANEMINLDAVQVAEMSAEEASELFMQRSKLARSMPGLQGKIDAITRELGFFALAVNLAAAHVAQTRQYRADPALYLVEYRRRRMTLLEQKPVDGYNNSVLAAWQTTYDAVHNLCPEACKMLELLAFLSPVDIPCEFFETSDPRVTCCLAEILGIEDPSDEPKFKASLNAALHILESFSLVQCKDDQKSYWMHNLVHVWSYERIESAKLAGLCTAVLRFLELFAFLVIRPARSVDEGLTSHVMACFAKLREQRQFQSPSEFEMGTFKSLSGLAVLLQFISFNSAHTLMSFIHQHCHLFRSYQPPLYVQHLLIFARLLSIADKSNEAESYLRQALAAYDQFDIPYDHSFFDCIRDLVRVIVDTSKSAEIEELLQLGWQKFKIIETDPDETAKEKEKCAVRLGDALGIGKKYIEAEQLFRQQLHEIGITQGPNHPRTLKILPDLAEALEAQQRYDEAQNVLMQVVDIEAQHSELVGRDVLRCMSKLVDLLARQGDLDGAEKMMRRTIDGFQRIGGSQNVDTLAAKLNLQEILWRRGRFDESLVGMEECVSISSEVFGKEHPRTVKLVMIMSHDRDEMAASANADEQ